MKALADWIGYQLVWWAAITGATHGLAWAGPLALLPFALLHLTWSGNVRVELRLMFAALLMGVLIDGALAWTGWLVYAAPVPALPAHGAPVWILALWAAFALTFTHGMRFLHGRPWTAVLLGLLGGPLAYLLATRTWDAVRFADPVWHGMLLLALGWAVAMPLLAALARHGLRDAGEGHPVSAQVAGSRR